MEEAKKINISLEYEDVRTDIYGMEYSEWKKISDTNKKMNILITGAAGFIGFHTCLSQLKKKNNIIGIDNINSYYDVKLKKARLKILMESKSFTFIKSNIQNPKLISKLKKIK